jgi:exosortase
MRDSGKRTFLAKGQLAVLPLLYAANCAFRTIFCTEGECFAFFRPRSAEQKSGITDRALEAKMLCRDHYGMATVVTPKLTLDESVIGHPAGVPLFLKAIVLTGLIVLVYARILADLAYDWWNNPAWSQGMLIPPFALYLAWLQRHVTLARRAAPSNSGLLLVAFACVVFLVGKLAVEFFLMRISFVLVLVGIIATFWGIARLRTLAFPLLLLCTMVPLPMIVYNSLAAPLQLFASDLATQLAQMLGVSVYRDGNIIHLATTSLGVVEACSGLNSLSALIVASLLLGYLLCPALLPRLLLVAISMPLAVAVNVLRVAGTAVLADYNYEFAMGFYHSFSGWLVFVGGFGVLYLIAKLTNRLFASNR